MMHTRYREQHQEQIDNMMGAVPLMFRAQLKPIVEFILDMLIDVIEQIIDEKMKDKNGKDN